MSERETGGRSGEGRKYWVYDNEGGRDGPPDHVFYVSSEESRGRERGLLGTFELSGESLDGLLGLADDYPSSGKVTFPLQTLPYVVDSRAFCEYVCGANWVSNKTGGVGEATLEELRDVLKDFGEMRLDMRVGVDVIKSRKRVFPYLGDGTGSEYGPLERRSYRFLHGEDFSVEVRCDPRLLGLGDHMLLNFEALYGSLVVFEKNIRYGDSEELILKWSAKRNEADPRALVIKRIAKDNGVKLLDVNGGLINMTGECVFGFDKWNTKVLSKLPTQVRKIVEAQRQAGIVIGEVERLEKERVGGIQREADRLYELSKGKGNE